MKRLTAFCTVLLCLTVLAAPLIAQEDQELNDTGAMREASNAARENQNETVTQSAAVKPQDEPGKEKDQKIVSVIIDGVLDAFYMRIMTGDFASMTPDYFPWQGEGDIRSFSPSVFDEPLNTRLNLSWQGEYFGGQLQFRAPLDTAFASNWDYEAWIQPLKYFKVSIGDLAKRGQVAIYQNFDDFLRTKIDNFGIMLPTWVLTPKGSGNNADTVNTFPWGYGNPGHIRGFFSYLGSDSNDLAAPAGTSTRPLMSLLAEGYVDPAIPLTFSFALGGLFESQSRPFKSLLDMIGTGSGTRIIGHDPDYDPYEATGLNVAFRAEGAAIPVPLVGSLTAALLYKYAATTLKKDDAPSAADTIDEKVGNHNFGIYANIPFDAVAGLGVSLGYTGLYQTWQNSQYEVTKSTHNDIGVEGHELSTYKSVQLPFYSGVDLRMRYNPPGLVDGRLTFTFNNNVTFAGAVGTVNQKLLYSKSWAYETQMNEDTVDGIENRRENYLGWYSALGVKFQVTQAFTADIQAANQFGTVTLEWENDPLTSFSNYLGVYAGGSWVMLTKGSAKCSIRGGVDVKISSFSYQDPIPTHTPVYQAGYMEFGIPVGIRVEF